MALDNSNPELIPMDDLGSFQETVKQLKHLYDLKGDFIGNYNYVAYEKAALTKFDFIVEAIKVIGYDGIERLKYKISDVKRKIIQMSTRTSEVGDVKRIANLLQQNASFSIGTILTRDYVKATMNNYYQELGINKKATANDIEDYYAIKERTKSVDGKQQRAVAIIKAKILVS